MARRWKIAGAAVAAFAIFLYANNASWLAPSPGGGPVLLANRGMAQSFPRGNIGNNDCTARMIAAPTHAYLENTIRGIRAAFDAGAGVVEIQVQPTTDGKFAVFHDATLDCRTDGHGNTRDHAMTALKRLDVGYGYTADGGKTFPLRGKGVGLMPSLEDVMTAFPDRRFLLALKNDGQRDGEGLTVYLQGLSRAQRDRLAILAAGPRSAAALLRVDGLRIMDRRRLAGCVIGYFALGWSGFVPATCHHTIVLLPVNVAGFVWGWPNRFLARMQAVDTEVFAAGTYGPGSGFGGLNSLEELRRLPPGYAGGIWTDEIGLIGPRAAR